MTPRPERRQRERMVFPDEEKSYRFSGRGFLGRRLDWLLRVLRVRADSGSDHRRYGEDHRNPELWDTEGSQRRHDGCELFYNLARQLHVIFVPVTVRHLSVLLWNVGQSRRPAFEQWSASVPPGHRLQG